MKLLGLGKFVYMNPNQTVHLCIVHLYLNKAHSSAQCYKVFNCTSSLHEKKTLNLQQINQNQQINVLLRKWTFQYTKQIF